MSLILPSIKILCLSTCEIFQICIYRHNVWQTSIRLAQSDESDTENGIVTSSSLTSLNISHNNVCFFFHRLHSFFPNCQKAVVLEGLRVVGF